MPKITINDKEILVDEGTTIIRACEIANVTIPRFCYHKKLSIAGNCRMCLVEVEKAPKLVASCATFVIDNMVIHTESAKVKEARAGVMEILLVNHPLDCPICDQGGECDLQDQAFKYGKPKNRFHESKRSVSEKDMGPLIKTVMNRCIHCTRCIRFAKEVGGIEEIGSINRGEKTEIIPIIKNMLESELSGNLIDVCPVGALTSKPYMFKARNWELKKTYSIDILDATCSNIQIDSKSQEVLRILPRENNEINELWISDKARFSYDGLKVQRIDTPYIKVDGKFRKASYQEAFELIASHIKNADPHEIGVIAGTLIDCESLRAMQEFMKVIGSGNIDANQFCYSIDTSSRGNYIFNTTISGINKADLCLLVGVNPRSVAPVIGARIGGAVRSGKLHVARVGDVDNQTYDIEELGNCTSILREIESGKHQFADKLLNASNPMLIIGDGVLTHKDSLAIQSILYKIARKYHMIREDWNGINMLHNDASIVGALDIGFSPSAGCKNANQMINSNDMKLIFLLGADDIDASKIHASSMVIYIGHHGDKSASHSHIVLPATAYTEKSGIYINTEGRAQITHKAVAPFIDAKPEWKIILDLAVFLGYNLPFYDIASLRNLLSKDIPAIAHMGSIISGNICDITHKDLTDDSFIKKVPINFYMTDPISRASVTMAKCAAMRGE